MWNGTKMDKTRSEPSTAPGSPVDSDNEESEADIDYDDVRSLSYLDLAFGANVMGKVLAVIDKRSTSVASPRGKRRTGRSYRDLTSLGSRPASPDGHGNRNGVTDLPMDEDAAQRLLRRSEKAEAKAEAKVEERKNGEVQGLDLRSKTD